MKISNPRGGDIPPWRTILSIAVFVGAVVVMGTALASGGGGLEGLARFLLLAAAAASLIDLIQRREFPGIRAVIRTFLGYLWRICSELLLIALMLPMLALIFVTGPVMAFLCLISLFIAGAYFLVKVLGISIQGIVITYGGLTALVSAVVAPLSGYVFFKCMDREDRWFAWWRQKVTTLFRFINRQG